MERNNIPFIHNWCDRWCERCSFTQRCAVFEMNESLSDEAADPENDAFWDTIASRFAAAHQMLVEGAAEHGLVLEEPTEAELAAYAREDDALQARLAENALIREADAYADTVELLFGETALWEAKGARLAQETELGIKTVEKGLSEVDLLADCRHVLGWYQHFIGIKFRRALQGLWEDDGNELQSDANGSAKIALLAVERSRIALKSLLQLLGHEDILLDLLAALERIEREGRRCFPEADRFRRPGFDDPIIHQN